MALIFRRSSGGAPPRIEQYEGRHAISMPAEEVKRAYATSVEKYPGSVVHEVRRARKRTWKRRKERRKDAILLVFTCLSEQ